MSRSAQFSDSPHLPTRALLAYGALGFPLAFVALPLYVHVPHLYASELGLSLAGVGLVLLLVRFGDALIDPWIGRVSDAQQASSHYGARRKLILPALLPLAIGFVLLLSPPAGAGMIWLAVSLLICFIGYSVATINYHAWGAELANTPAQQGLAVRITSTREGLALCGVIVAAVLPGLFANSDDSGLRALAWLFPPLLGLAALALWRGVPTSAKSLERRTPTDALNLRQLLRADPGFVRLLLVLATGGVAAAIPATLVLFYIADVLQLGHWQGGFLALYFVAGAGAMPLWVKLADRFGKVTAWALAMAVAILSFLWAALLGPGDGIAFALICVASGAALGAELALPPALLAERLNQRAESAAESQAGSYFGVWNFVNKFSLALAAGAALPLLDALGYKVGAGGTASGDSLAALAIVYALLPAIIKTLALVLLLRWRNHWEFRA
jgi:Na+/melibiose symporter-like transporter